MSAVPLKLKIFMAFLLVSILCIAVLGGVLTKLFYDEMMNSLRTTEQKSNDLIMRDVDDFIDNLRNISEAFVLDEEIKQVLLDLQRNNSFSNYNAHTREIYNKMYIYGHNMNRKIWRICIYPQDTAYPFVSTRTMYTSDYDITTKPWYGPLTGSGEKELVYGVHQENGINCISVVRPIYQTYTQRVLGVIAMDVRASEFRAHWSQARLVDAGPETFYYLYDGAGNIVTCSDRDGQAGYDQKLGGEGGRYIKIESVSDHNWRFVTLIPYQRLSSKLSAMWRTISLFFALALALCLGGTWLLSSVVTRPIQRIYMNMLRFERLRTADGAEDPPVSDKRLGQGFDKMTEQIVDMTDENNRIQAELQRADLMVRQAQINPHFIYNTLNSIKWIADMQGSRRIVSALDATIRLLRFSAKKDETLVSIRDELDFCRDYMNLIGLKNLDNTEVLYELGIEHPEKYLVPRFILQPILENAIQHGFGERMAGNRIEIGIRESDGLLLITVRDNGKGMERALIEAVLQQDGTRPHSFNQIGIHNVDSRIKHIYGARYGVSIKSEPGAFTEVTIALPAITEEGNQHDSSGDH